MAIYKRFSPTILSAFSIVIMLITWVAFAPVQAGGMASYTIIIGKSMEPKFHIGDLVIVHKEPQYQIGDAIVYRNLELKNFVFHRIVSEELGHYTLQGDNNSWLDSYEPTQDEVLGKLWLHIPRGGAALQKMRSPITMAMLAALVGVVFAVGLFKKKSQGNKRMNTTSVREWFASLKSKTQSWFSQASSSEIQGSSIFEQDGILEGSFFVLGLIVLLSLALGIISFSRPASRLAKNDVSFEHLGIFSYSAQSPQGVYDSNALKSGDPIFTRLTCSVDINLQYKLIAPQAENISGTYQLTAVIREQVSGWQRNVPLQEQTSFTGTDFGTSATLDLCKMESLTQSMETGTDFHPAFYTLLISPNIKLNGSVSALPLDSVFNSGLTFQYDRIHFYLSSSEETGNPLSFTEMGLLHEEHKEANTMLLLGNEIAVPAMRLFSIVGFIASLMGFVFLGLRLQSISRNNPEHFFRVKYDSLMVDIQNEDSIALSNSVEVTSMDALAKLAERFNAMILHAQQGSLHAYYVRDSGTTYRFVMNAPQAGAAIPASEATSRRGGS